MPHIRGERRNQNIDLSFYDGLCDLPLDQFCAISLSYSIFRLLAVFW